MEDLVEVRCFTTTRAIRPPSEYLSPGIRQFATVAQEATNQNSPQYTKFLYEFARVANGRDLFRYFVNRPVSTDVDAVASFGSLVAFAAPDSHITAYLISMGFEGIPKSVHLSGITPKAMKKKHDVDG